MKILAFTSKNSINQTYASLLNKYKTYHGIVDLIKIGIVALSVLFFTLIYLYFVNKSSTQGYFLRQANNELSTIKFKYEIVKTNVLGYKQKNREQMHDTFGTNDRVIDVHATITSIPNTKEITLR